MLCPGKCIVWCVVPFDEVWCFSWFPSRFYFITKCATSSQLNCFFFWVFPPLWCESLLLIDWVLVLWLLVVQLKLLLFPLDKTRFAFLILCCYIKECCSYDVLLDSCGVMAMVLLIQSLIPMLFTVFVLVP